MLKNRFLSCAVFAFALAASSMAVAANPTSTGPDAYVAHQQEHSQMQKNDSDLFVAPTGAEVPSVAPRVTQESIEALVMLEYFHVVPGTTLTLCVLTLRNGFTVVGESACASPENFDEEVGRRFARVDAARKIWALEGYALRERLAAQAEG